MFSSKSLITLGLASLPLAFATIHNVQVGADGLAFTPEAISAEIGDQVVFTFMNKNHSVTQSSFDSPCSAKEGGENSGFMPVPANQTDNLPIHTISIYDTNPLWIFCAQTAPVDHCGQGMIFAVNCPGDDSPNSFSNFKKAALAFGASLNASATPSSTPDASSGGYGGGYGSSGSTDASVTDSSATPAATDSSSSSSTPSADSSNSASSSNSSNIVKVIVGDASGDLTFNPSNISAPIGTTIQFEFHQKNHSVVQSTFPAPCSPMAGGFKSDFFGVDPTATTFQTWSITVNDSNPIWAYCRQTQPKSHCGAGMVFSVNANEASDKSFTAFKNAAEAQNGTTNGTTSDTSGATGGNGNGALSGHANGMGMGVVVAAVAVLASLL
ncbi:hypothetical protein D9758_000150 [Tetrapyrgos nigripes]|uniref:Cupredoxin n=1 Tax=Tetrapyrgos nigripes TaxID=182062 RepID=A0A8H5H178_9AGAR|nr:hypothetical protein D9758_000150 [Tetrapyrgos nigripes]